MEATESVQVLAMSVIDASEGFAVAVVEVHGNFLTADMEEDMYLILDGPLVDLM